MGVVVAWWRPRSSKSVWGGDPVPGGFDSHPLPPAQNPGGAYSPGFLLYNGPISTWRSIVTVLRIFILGLLLLTSTTALIAQPGPVASPSQTPIVVDHNSVALFERIPENYLMATQATSMLYMDRSVGGNISEGLDCLAFPTDEVSLNHCRRWAHVDPNFSVSREDLNWSRPGGYNRANWDFVFGRGAAQIGAPKWAASSLMWTITSESTASCPSNSAISRSVPTRKSRIDPAVSSGTTAESWTYMTWKHTKQRTRRWSSSHGTRRARDNEDHPTVTVRRSPPCPTGGTGLLRLR